MKTKVKVDFYKATGKWYTTMRFESEHEPYDMLEIKDEVMSKNPIKNQNFIIEASKGTMRSKRLFIMQLP